VSSRGDDGLGQDLVRGRGEECSANGAVRTKPG